MLSSECLLYFRPADVQRQERGYYRYLAEFKFGNDKKDVAALSMETYEVYLLLDMSKISGLSSGSGNEPI
ncbi:hypothetical protein SSX86_030844 [Deinandra increscens subsp. villosa]|uniref:Uncharacterized protein n=1 Tax=Deinandra increscens subsp. villosa TaxID=3103831 RepID=A0AAP0C564_9ASTR